MIRTVIVDDVALAREAIRGWLVDEADIEVVGEAADGPEAVSILRRLLPDLVFLDVQLPGLDGFQVLERTVYEHLPAVIFVTAFDRYAVQAFEKHALDYLLKPIEPERFRDALGRARHALSNGHGDGMAAQQMVLLLQSADGSRAGNGAQHPAASHRHRFAVKDRDRFILLKTDEIDWIEAAADYAELHARGRAFLLRVTMSELEKQLDPQLFARIHRSTIVNIERVTEIRSQVHGDFEVALHDGTKLRMSRRFRSQLLP